VKASGEYRRIASRWLSPYEKPAADWRMVLRYVLWVALPLVVLLLASVQWSRMLKKQVAARTSDPQAQVQERTRAEDAVRQRDRELRLIMDTAPALIAYVDAGLRFLRANRSCQEWFGLPAEEVRGRLVREVFGNEGWKQVRPYVERALAGEAVAFEAPVPSAPDGVRLALWTLAPENGGEGGRRGFVMHAVDITERRQAEEDRARLQMELAHAQRLEAVGTLARGAAHEINNPINGVINYAQMIIDAADEESPIRRYAAEISREANRVADIVRNLLRFTRRRSSSLRVGRVEEIVEQTLLLMRHELSDDGILLEAEVTRGLPPVPCRCESIQQVLMNLIANARDALNAKFPGAHPEKRLGVAVRLVEEQGRRWVRMTVADRGGGIAPEVQGRVFDPFFTTKPRHEGMGLGLAVSRAIVMEHGGRIHFETEPGSGTQFHVDLPVNGEEPDGEGEEV
jgi:PAS domain S-box-containing protein